ncbi:unnamed protein product [Vicia faba]|uniref:Uncharacterized protein n=1 Tax=Vicia faba TaxID=3906 RepID=A0AAV1A5P3_VICFA|nr:unnamed protein product [Vicia faba]
MLQTQCHLRFRLILFIFIYGPLGFDSNRFDININMTTYLIEKQETWILTYQSLSDASLMAITKRRNPVVLDAEIMMVVLKRIMEEDGEDVDCEDVITLKLEEDA